MQSQRFCLFLSCILITELGGVRSAQSVSLGKRVDWKNNIFWKNVGNQKQLMLAIDFHSIFFFHIVEVNGYRQLSGYQHSSKYLLCAQQKQETHKGLEQFMGEKLATEFSFLGELCL